MKLHRDDLRFISKEVQDFLNSKNMNTDEFSNITSLPISKILNSSYEISSMELARLYHFIE